MFLAVCNKVCVIFFSSFLFEKYFPTDALEQGVKRPATEMHGKSIHGHQNALNVYFTRTKMHEESSHVHQNTLEKSIRVNTYK